MAKNGNGVETVKVTDTEIADLINEGSRLKKQADKIGNRLSDIKEELTLLDLSTKTKHITPKGRYVTISGTATFTDIEPVKARKALTEKRLGPKFVQCVKIHLASLRKHLSEDEIAELRVKTGTSRSYSFG